MKTIAPSHLEAPEALFFEQMTAEYGISDVAGLQILTTACESLERARRCRAIINEQGEVTPAGKNHPLLLAEAGARKGALGAIKQLEVDIETTSLSAGRPVTSTAPQKRVK